VKSEITVLRKGGNRQRIGFGETAKIYIAAYHTERIGIKTVTKALFLNKNKERLCYNGINKIVKLYNPTNRSITTHVTRKSVGTGIYNSTGDVKLVATVLGHAKISTSENYIHTDNDRANEYLKTRY
jgi:site-specific recombinase XerD